MRFRTAFIDVDSRRIVEQDATSLAAAIDILRSSFTNEDASPDAIRDHLRWWSVEMQAPLRLWGELPDGGWLSLDPEDAQDALCVPDGIARFEAGILPPATPLPHLTYRLRMEAPDGSEAITDHENFRSVFEAISETWSYRPPLKPGFTDGLWRIDATPCHFALSARSGSGVAAVPLPLADADAALGSNHAALELEVEMRSALTRDR